MLAYSLRSRNIMNSSWGIMGVMILVLILITDYSVPKEFYITGVWSTASLSYDMMQKRDRPI